MTTTAFLILLTAFSTVSSLVTEAIKKFISDDENRCYNSIALGVAVVVGGVGTIIYYVLNNVPLNANNIIYAVLMGLASGLVAMVGYDKVKQAIEQFGGK